MAGTKKRKTRSRKNKTISTDEKQDILRELDGFTVGDSVWYRTVSNDIGYGKIVMFHTNESAGNVVEIYDEINCGFRCSLLETATMTAPKGGKRKLTNARHRNASDTKKK